MSPDLNRELTIAELVEEINRHCMSDETVGDVMAMADGLATLAVRLNLTKAQYAKLGLKIGYTWIKRLIKIGRDDKLRNSDIWRKLPAGRSHLVELSLMKPARFLQGLEADPDQNNTIVIHPAANREDLRLYRIMDEPIKHPNRQDSVLLVILPIETPDQEFDYAGIVNAIRRVALSEECSFVGAEVISKTKKETLRGNIKWRQPELHSPDELLSEEETIWTISQTDVIERPPKRRKDETY